MKSVVVWEDELAHGSTKVKGWSATQQRKLDTEVLEDRISLKVPDEICTFVYTSGTTGPPKVTLNVLLLLPHSLIRSSQAVMLSHRNITSLARSMANSPFFEDDISLNFLPLAHVAEKIIGFYTRIDRGLVQISLETLFILTAGLTNCFATSVAQVLPELQEVAPTLFGAVPRIFEKAYAKIMYEISKKVCCYCGLVLDSYIFHSQRQYKLCSTGLWR